MKPLLRTIVVAACLACVCPASALAGIVSVTIRDGRVTLRAQDATVRQIMAEWARVGKITVVNLDRVPGGPVSIELTDVPESQALGIVLRSIGGFVAAPRPVRDPQVSQFDRIVVMPVLATVAPVATPAQAARPGAQGPQPFRPLMPGFPDSMQNRRRGEPSEPPDMIDLNDEPDGEPVNNEQRLPPARPPMGMRPQQGMPGSDDATGDNERGVGTTGPGTPLQRPGVVTAPAGAVARPGQIVPTPPKPPGQTVPQTPPK